MRILGVLVALQCAGIAFLVYRSLAGGPVPAPGPAQPVAGIAAPASPPLAGTPDEERLRQIIREELAALPVPGGRDAAPVAAAALRDPGRDRAQRERVESQIAHYRSVGAISERQMMELQADIARLDPSSRRDMLNELTRAMNAKEIKGLM